MFSRFAWLYSCSFVWPLLLLRELELDERDRFDADERLEDDRPDDDREDDEREEPELFDREELFASPFSARCLFTVRAAISFARFVERPCFFSLSLMCSYWRSRLLDHVFGIYWYPL